VATGGERSGSSLNGANWEDGEDERLSEGEELEESLEVRRRRCMVCGVGAVVMAWRFRDCMGRLCSPASSHTVMCV
jgi:hypothetical protein